jgi:hypothetical protein
LTASAESAGGGLSEFFAGLAEGLGIGTGIELVKQGFEGATEAIGEAVSKVREWVGESLKTQQNAVRTAAALHVHVDTLEGLQAAGKRAGIGTDELNEALAKTNHAIGEAATKGGDATKAFTSLGLNVKQLAGQSLDKSIGQMADALAAIKNPAEQAAAAGEIFGERLGPRLLPLLQKGSAGIAEITEEAKKAGVALDDVDAGKLASAQASIDEVGEHFEGIKNQLTIALAPAIKAIADSIINLLPPADEFKTVFIQAFRDIVLLVAKVQDFMYPIEQTLWNIAKACAGIIEAVASFTFHDLIGADTGHSAEEAAKWLDEITNKANQAGQALENGIDQPIAQVADHISDTAEKVQEMLQKMHDQITEFGMTDAQKKVFEIKQAGGDEFDISTAETLAKKLDALEKYKKDQEESKQLIEDSLSPLDKYQKKLADIARLYREHLLDAKQRQDALNKAADELNKKDKDKDQKSAAETRRFDFSKHGKKTDSTQAQLLEQARKQAIDTNRIRFIQDQFYNQSQTQPKVYLYNF